MRSISLHYLCNRSNEIVFLSPKYSSLKKTKLFPAFFDITSDIQFQLLIYTTIKLILQYVTPILSENLEETLTQIESLK